MIGTYDTVYEPYVFIYICDMFEILHTDDSYFIVEFIHKTMVFIYKYYAAIALLYAVVSQLYHLTRLATAFMSNK